MKKSSFELFYCFGEAVGEVVGDVVGLVVWGVYVNSYVAASEWLFV